jgi:hypothetical protein
MKKIDLAKLALYGMIAGSYAAFPFKVDAAPENQRVGQMSQNNDQNKVSSASKKDQDQSTQKDSKNDKSSKGTKEPKSTPSAPGQEDCGAFCATGDASDSQSTKSSEQLKLKRTKLI